MWVATTSGFFSAVQHRSDNRLLVVRTRVREDAEHLAQWYQDWGTWGERDPQPQAKLTTYEWSDYPWRVILPREAWADFMVAQTTDLDYGNFKDAVKTRQGPRRAGIYSGVWATLLGLEDMDPRGRPAPQWHLTEPVDQDSEPRAWEEDDEDVVDELAWDFSLQDPDQEAIRNFLKGR